PHALPGSGLVNLLLFFWWTVVDEGTLPSLATPIVEQPKKERPKKTRKEVLKKLPSPVRSLTPKSPEPVVEEVQVTLKSREPTPEHVPTPTPKIPDLPPVDIPPLPEITEEKKEKKPKVDNRKPFEPIQVMPQIKDAVPPPPKKSKPPTITKKSLPKKRVPSAEAPVTTEEIRQMKDPLDFLAKYCIISKDRLPYYERIYKNVVSSQPERYERAHPLSPTTGMPVTEGTSWGNHELNMFHDLVVISRGQDPPRPALSEPEQYLEKICYTLEMLDGKHRQLTEDLNLLESKRIQQLAERARKLVPDITSVHFKKKEKKSKKKKKKKNKVEQEEIPAKVILSRADITDDVIVSRIDDKLLKKLMKEPAQHQLNCEIERCTEKLANIEDRLIQLEGEKNIIGMYCMELFFEAQNDNNKPREFRRQQSFLYKTLHPDPDVEMNKEELEGALQIVNHNLLSQNEFSYLYHILNLTGRRKINFKLFCVIAALSERITHMDPVIRELLNKEKGWKRQNNDYESLDVRLNRSK
ncbi:titin-like, partial [Saccostrea cucullata]|uniref:titin-like n=1 Tax=Saccostrea cuccullata TaxID=36930 RepID=UPI002ED21DD8